MLPVTAFYAAILTPLYMLLSLRVIAQRREAKVEIGAGESGELLRRIRVHANFAEYVPFALLLMGLAESVKAPALALHALGVVLFVSRLVHAYALSQTPHILRLRVLGMQGTLAVIAIAALLCFVLGGLQIVV